jgi:NAD(P)-dependent dehydrogenase (short-subunit alcohol dehydrogenase family)
MVEQCIRRFGRLDVLVNNAGTSSWAPLLDYPEDSWREVMGTNLEGPFFLTQAAVAEMRRRRWGRVINIASVYASLALNNYFYGDRMPAESAGDRGPVRASAYHASKSGLLTMTKDLAVAVARWGITVNTVSPGMLMTDLADNLLDDEVRRRIEEMTPLGRFGRPEEVGYAVRFLASEESSFITGTELVIDGGWSIW